MSACRPDAELRKTLSVALNKLGDLQYLRQSLPAARDSYHEALAVRRTALREAEAGIHEGPALAERHVDMAVSLAKVADIEKVGSLVCLELGCQAGLLYENQNQAAIEKLGQRGT